MADDNTTYGPSEERRTRTPIKFKKDIKAGDQTGVAGVFRLTPSSLMDAIRSKISGESGSSIEIDPSASNDPNQTIRHEAIHALLSGQNMDQINSQLPAFAQMKSVFPSSGYGDPNQEIPAFAATGEASRIYQHPIPGQFIDNYIDQLKGALQKINPGLVSKYSSITDESRNLNASNGSQ